MSRRRASGGGGASLLQLDDSLTHRIRDDEQQWAHAQTAAAQALAQNTSVVRRTRADLALGSGRAVLRAQQWQPAPERSSRVQREFGTTKTWRQLHVPQSRDPLAAAAQSAEAAAAAAIDAVEASRERWQADLSRARELAARLEMAAREVRQNFAVGGSVDEQEGGEGSFPPSPYENLRTSSSTDASTGTWEAAASPAAVARRPEAVSSSTRRQTLSSSPHPALSRPGGRASPLAAQAASPHDPSAFAGN